MDIHTDDRHTAEIVTVEPSNIIPGWQEGIPFIRLFACGPFTIEVLHEVPGGDPSQARYVPLPPERLHGRGPAPALTFLKLLTSHPDRYAPKDWLIEHLRGDEYLITPKRLENIVSFVRQFLSLPDGTKPPGMLRYVRASHESGDGYRLAPYPLIWLDVDALAHTVRQACLLERFGDDPLPYWERAYQLASRGTYLAEEPYSDWAEARREEVEGHLRQCVHALARLWLARQGASAEEEVLHLLRRYWPRHPEDEDVAWSLMDLLGRRGRYQEALEVYATLEQSLEEEGLTKDGKPRVPDQRTRDLADYLHFKERQPLIRRQQQRESTPSPSAGALVQHNGQSVTPAPLMAVTGQEEMLVLFSSAVKQGILHAISELEGPLPVNAADRTLRRAIVAALGGMPFTEWVLPSSILPDASQQRSLLQEDLLTFFERTVTNLWKLYYSDGAGEVIHEITPLMRAIIGLLPFALGSAQHKRVLTLLTLGYQLQCCVLRDQMDYPQAHIAYQRAFDAAKELEDVALIASALAREGVTFIQQEQPEQALLYLNAALPMIDGQTLPLLKGYILQALSEAHAKLHQDQACWHCLTAAEKSILVDQERLPEKNVGLIRCNTVSIVAQKGVDAVLLQDYAQSIHLISSSLEAYDPRLVRGRARLVAQRAEAYYGLGELDACIQNAEESLTLAQAVGSNKTRSRIEKLHTDLCQSRWRKEESVARLGAMLRESQT